MLPLLGSECTVWLAVCRVQVSNKTLIYIMSRGWILVHFQYVFFFFTNTIYEKIQAKYSRNVFANNFFLILCNLHAWQLSLSIMICLSNKSCWENYIPYFNPVVKDYWCWSKQTQTHKQIHTQTFLYNQLSCLSCRRYYWIH